MILAATGFDFLLHRHEITTHGFSLIITGFITAFLCAIAVVKWLLSYLSRHTFAAFGWYRIIVGGLVLVLLSVR
jgi:undecaprenyl-diphosphatase